MSGRRRVKDVAYDDDEIDDNYDNEEDNDTDEGPLK